jgi:hypothetical protein
MIRQSITIIGNSRVFVLVVAALAGGAIAAAVGLTGLISVSGQGSSGMPNPGSLYDSISEAEQHIDFELREPSNLPPGWQLQSVQVLNRINQTQVVLNYVNPAADTQFFIVQSPQRMPAAIAGGEKRDISVNGLSGIQDRGPEDNPNLITITWWDDDFTLVVSGVTGPKLTESDSDRVVHSIE